MATTKTDPKAAAVSERDVKKTGKTYEGLSREQLVEAYRHMYTSRLRRGALADGERHQGDESCAHEMTVCKVMNRCWR